jgi:hypothetical protein
MADPRLKMSQGRGRSSCGLFQTNISVGIRAQRSAPIARLIGIIPGSLIRGIQKRIATMPNPRANLSLTDRVSICFFNLQPTINMDRGKIVRMNVYIHSIRVLFGFVIVITKNTPPITDQVIHEARFGWLVLRITPRKYQAPAKAVQIWAKLPKINDVSIICSFGLSPKILKPRNLGPYKY